MKYDLKSHPRLCQNHSSISVYRPIFMKSVMIANIMMTQFFINVNFMLWRSFFYIFTAELITTLTYVLMNNFCHFFYTPWCSSCWTGYLPPPASHRSEFLGRRVKVGEVGEILGYFIPCLLKPVAALDSIWIMKKNIVSLGNK